MPPVIEKLLEGLGISDKVIMENPFIEVTKEKAVIRQCHMGITKNQVVIATHILLKYRWKNQVDYYYKNDIEPDCEVIKQISLDSIIVSIFSYHSRILKIIDHLGKTIYLELSERQNNKKVWKKWMLWTDAIQKRYMKFISDSEESEYSTDSSVERMLTNDVTINTDVFTQETSQEQASRASEGSSKIIPSKYSRETDFIQPSFSDGTVTQDEKKDVIPMELMPLLHSKDCKTPALPHKFNIPCMKKVITWTNLKDQAENILKVWELGVPSLNTQYSKFLGAFLICKPPERRDLPFAFDLPDKIGIRVRKTKSEPYIRIKYNNWLLTEHQIAVRKRKSSQCCLLSTVLSENIESTAPLNMKDDLEFLIRDENTKKDKTITSHSLFLDNWKYTADLPQVEEGEDKDEEEENSFSNFLTIVQQYRQHTLGKNLPDEKIKGLKAWNKLKKKLKRQQKEKKKPEYENSDFKKPTYVTFSQCSVKRKPNSTFASMSNVDVAHELTRIQITLFTEITITEIITTLRRQDLMIVHYPSLMIRRLLLFNERLTNLTITEILNGSTIRERVYMIVKFIRISIECVIMSNYQAAFAVIVGLLSVPILMIERTLEYFRKKHHWVYRDFVKLCHIYKTPKLRRDIQWKAINTQKPTIPYFLDFLNLCEKRYHKAEMVEEDLTDEEFLASPHKIYHAVRNSIPFLKSMKAKFNWNSISAAFIVKGKKIMSLRSAVEELQEKRKFEKVKKSSIALTNIQQPEPKIEKDIKRHVPKNWCPARSASLSTEVQTMLKKSKKYQELEQSVIGKTTEIFRQAALNYQLNDKMYDVFSYLLNAEYLSETDNFKRAMKILHQR